jgi:hypothetical protein
VLLIECPEIEHEHDHEQEHESFEAAQRPLRFDSSVNARNLERRYQTRQYLAG